MNNVQIRKWERELFEQRDALVKDLQETTHPALRGALECLLEFNRDMLVSLPQCDVQQDRDMAKLEDEHRRSVKRVPPENMIDVFDAAAVIKRLYRRGDKKTKMRLHHLYMLAIGGTPPDRVTEDEIDRARYASIENILAMQGVQVRNRQCCCVFHTEDTPSMHIYPNNSYFCFGCGASGDAITLYRHLHGADFKTAVRALQQF